MISISVVLSLLTVHFIADFMFQSDRMAKEKSTCNIALVAHVTTYISCFFFLLVGLAFKGYIDPNPKYLVIVWLVANAIIHFVVDYTTSRINSALFKSGNIHEFFVCVGADQLIHMITLIVTTYYILM